MKTIRRFDTATGHYTQVVWAKTTKLGCGYIYQNAKHTVVCNYNPAGNFISQPIYKTGRPCTACPSTMAKCDDGLCTA